MNESILSTNREHAVTAKNGWIMLPVVIALQLGSLALFIYSIATSDQNGGHPQSADRRWDGLAWPAARHRWDTVTRF